jgi:hypothetical protein
LELLAEKVKHPEGIKEKKHQLTKRTANHKNSANAVNLGHVGVEQSKTGKGGNAHCAQVWKSMASALKKWKRGRKYSMVGPMSSIVGSADRTDSMIDGIIIEAAIGAIVLHEGAGSVDHRLECCCLVLVAAHGPRRARDVPRSQDVFDFPSKPDFENSEVGSGPANGSQLLTVSDLLTASN